MTCILKWQTVIDAGSKWASKVVVAALRSYVGNAERGLSKMHFDALGLD